MDFKDKAKKPPVGFLFLDSYFQVFAINVLEYNLP